MGMPLDPLDIPYREGCVTFLRNPTRNAVRRKSSKAESGRLSSCKAFWDRPFGRVFTFFRGGM